MTSKQSDNIIDTSCKDCVFAIYDGDTQVECFAGRLEKFKKNDVVIDAYDDEKEFYVIRRLCNLNRTEKQVDELRQELTERMHEIAVTYELIIDCSNGIKEQDVFELIDSYYVDKLTIRLIHGEGNDLDDIHKILQLSNKIITKYNTKCPITQCLHYNVTMHNIIEKSKKSFHAVVKANDIKDKNILHKVNAIINEDLEKVIVVDSKDGSFISNLAYKVQAFSKEDKNYTEIVEKIVTYSKDVELYKCL